MCTPGGASTAKGIGTIGDGHSEICEGQVRHLGVFASFCVQTHVLLTSVEGMAPKLQPKPREDEAQAAEAPKEAAEATPVPKEGKPQAPKDSATPPAEAAAPKEAKPQARKAGSYHLCQQPRLLGLLDGVLCAEDRHSTKTCLSAPRHSVCRVQVTSGVRASTKCDAVLKGAIPFCAFAH